MEERVKTLRKSLGLTQAEFSEALNMAKAYIGQVECGSRSLSDRTIRDICRIYDVNEEWLRSGVGEMHTAKTKNEELASFFNDVLSEEPESVRRVWFESFSKLPFEAWQALDRLADEYVKNKKG